MALRRPYDINEFDDDYLEWSDDEDGVCTSKYVVSSSSDEDAEKFLEKIKSKKLVKKARASDGKDDFEREMASELSMTMQQLTAKLCQNSSAGATTSATKDASEGEEPEECYDEIYFDSDDSESEELSHKPSGSTSRKGNRRVLSNDELFYDPKMDDRDQAWMDKQRRSYQFKNKKRHAGGPKASKESQPLPESDAVLNCPACLTMLCMDCQRHEIYHNQYRAMFVFNCNVNWTEFLKFPKKNQKKEFFKNKKKFKKTPEQVEGTASSQQENNIEVNGNSEEKNSQVSKDDALKRDGLNLVAADSNTRMELSGRELEAATVSTDTLTEKGSKPEELFHPVTCTICNTKVAVYDTDEVYHFFNIVTSY